MDQPAMMSLQTSFDSATSFPSYAATGRYRGGGLEPFQGQEVVSRQAEWEREIDTLDQKEMELHQSQLRLIREQTAVFIRDLGVLQQEVAALKPLQAHQTSVAERMDYLERVVGDSADRHARELQAAHGRLEQLHGRLADQHGAGQEHEARHLSLARRVEGLEQQLQESANRHARELHEAKTATSRLESTLEQAHEERHATVADRLAYLEKVMGDSVDKHDKALKQAHARLEQMHDSFGQQHGYLKDSHDSVQSRLDQLEQLIRGSVDRHERELEAAKASHGKLANDAKVRETQNATLQQRVELLERSVGESVERHAKEIDFARNKLDQLHGRLGEHHAQLVHHATLAERISFVEKLVGDSAEKHAEELSAAHAKVDQMRSKLSGFEAHGATIEGLRKAHASLQSDKAKHEAHYSSLGERLDYVESVVGELAEKFGREGGDSKRRLEQLHSRLEDCERHGQAIAELHQAHASARNDKATSDAHHASTRERLDYLESLIGGSADKHLKEVEALKTAHAKAQTESKQRDSFHASMAERLSYLEQLVGDSADQQAQALAAAHEKLEQMHTRVSLCEAHGVAIDGLKKSHASLAGDKASVGSLRLSLEQRLEHLERLMNEASQQQSRELAKAHSKLDQLHGRVSAAERGVGALGELQQAHASFSSERAQLGEQQQQLHARLEELRRTVADHGERHGRELEAVKAAHGRLAGDLRAKDSHGASAGSKVEQLEATVTGVVERHKRELADAHAKIAGLQGRLSEDKARHEEHVRSLLANEKETRDLHHATLRERVDYLEGVLGESKTKHDQEMEALKMAHSAHAKESKAVASRHATVEERLERMESLLKDSLDGHAQHISAAHQKLEQVHQRVAACEKHGARLAELHGSHAGQATDKVTSHERAIAELREQLGYVESVLGDSAAKHQRQVQEAVQAAHAKLTTENRQRDARHATFEERLHFLEQNLGDSAQEHMQGLTAAHAKLEDMHTRLAMCEAHGTAIETLKKAHAKLQSDHSSREGQHASVAERLAYLEQLVGDSADRHARELAAAHAKVEEVHRRVLDEKAAREAHGAALDGAPGRGSVAEHQDLRSRVDALEGKVAPLPAKCNDLQQAVRRLMQSQEQKDQHVSEHINSEKQARTAHEQEVLSRLAQERSAREAHEHRVADHLGKERQVREQHHKLVQDLLGGEREERLRHASAVEQELRRHAASSEAGRKEIQDAVSKDRFAREHSGALQSDSLHRERLARGSAEDLVAQERAERTRQNEAVNERVDSLQKSVNIFDKLIRTEMDERSKENRRIWDAIDNHTHDLSTQVIGEDGLPLGVAAAGGVVGELPPRVVQQAVVHGAAAPPVGTTAFALPAPMAVGPLQSEPMIGMSRPVSPMPMFRPAAPGSFVAGSPGVPLQVQAPGSAGPGLGGMGGLGGAGGHHYYERLACGHTHYGADRSRPAEIRVE